MNRLPDNEFSTDLEAMPSSDVAYSNSLKRFKKRMDEKTNNGWISVKDRLPEFDKDVLVFDCWKTREGEQRLDCRVSSLKSVTTRKTFNGIVNDCEWYGEYNFNITHWMPLPDPPKEG